MKLIVAIGHNREQARVAEALLTAGFAFTKVGSTGGFLRQGSTTLLIGTEEADVPQIMAIIHEHCQKAQRIRNFAHDPNPALTMGMLRHEPVVEQTGGGIAFVLNVESVERF